MNIVEPYARIIDIPDREEGIAILRDIELFGRVSHRSEDAQSPDSWQRFIESVVMGHGDWCYDERTEVLTSAGWKFWKNIVLGDKLATLSPQGYIEYQFPTNLVKSYYAGNMYSVNGRNVNLLVTPNHRLYICPTSTREGRRKLKFFLIKATDIQHKSHAYLKKGQYTADNPISYGEAQFIGFAIGDGYIDMNPRRGSTIRFEIKRSRKKEYLRMVCANAGLNFSEKNSNKPGCVIFHVSAKNNIQHYLLQIYDHNREKQIPPTLLLSGQETCSGILDGLVNSDGSVDPRTGISFSTTSRTLEKTFQQLCLHAGRAADLTYVSPSDRKNSFPNAKPCYQFQILSNSSMKPEVNKFSKSLGRTQWEPWQGNVYCAEVPNGTLYVRRMGKAVWSGNSITEHAKASVEFYTDRGVGEEQVRHRLFSYTKESTRFVSYLKKLGFSVTYPRPSDADRHPAWVHAMETCESSYFELLKDGWSPQEARSVIPLAFATKTIATGNLRSWRHLFLMRTTKETHPQMRQVIIPLLEEFKSKIPLLFEDIIPLATQRENLKKPR